MNDLATAAPATRGASPLVAKARALAPVFRAQAAANEAAGRLTDETIAALRTGDFFGLMVPRCFGGIEAPLPEILEIYETISEADSSTGWVLMAGNVCIGSAAGYLPPKGAQAVFGNRKTIPIIAGEGGPRGRAEVDGKGFRLTGRWSYGSGVVHTEWLHTGAMIYENGKPRLLPGTNIHEMRTFIVPTKDCEFLGNWDSLGLRATASIDYAIKDLYVPEEFTHSPNALVAVQGGNLFKIGIVGMSPIGHTGVALGIGRRVLDELRDLANAPSGRPSAAFSERGGSESFQVQYGAAEAKLRAGRALCYEVWSDIQATLDRGEDISQRQFTLMRLSLNHATTAVAEVCAFTHKAASGVSLRNGVLQRCFRDMNTATQHRIVSDYMLRECGRELLGLGAGKMWTSRGLADRP
jgi:alkylation response protein AidB-like acyl-CoA dehydrogenase